ncbi:MAG: NAD-dependent epimerase/dehydratase family protein, partial [Acidimicrobiia bacterium]|nr:NAD-dependent epimerase/dehydratase family protein [Acidimicrobiia bacterium]
DIIDPAAVRSVVSGSAVSVFHLASVVSGAGERDFDLAYRVNVDGLLNLIRACREVEPAPRFVFTSSIAVFGGAEPVVGDDTKHSSETSYGVTKSIGEGIVNDASRKGFIDGRTARLPHVIIRPGPPNAAASGFASAVFREPLAGRDYELPVSLGTVMPVTGVRAVIDALVALHEVDPARLGRDRAFGLPALPVTVEQMVETLRRHRGAGSVTLAPDPFVQAIVDRWPKSVDGRRARSLGITGSGSLDAIVDEYLEDFGGG